MTRLIPKKRPKVKDRDQSVESQPANSLQAKKSNTRSSGKWSIEEVLNAKDITPSKNWKWNGTAFTNE